ncbi:MAG: SigF/SigG family RNA polymerase sporulation sigma factor [Lachnospiraceae bacterium]|nr:SigF/SigG family RNA polymerase sporulation sigma factor [Lachnospiraceae bacterium]
MADEVIRLIEAAHQGDKGARDRLVTENMGLIWSIVRRFSGRGYELEDLFQIGSIGLLKAIDKFDTNYEVKFSTYAVPMIQGEIKRFLRDDGMVKVSRTLKENGWKVKKAAEQLAFQLGRDATLEEIAATTELSVEDIIMAMEANEEVESIYRTVYQGDGNEIYLLDKIEAREDSSFGQTESLLNHMMIEQLLKELSKEEKKLIILRYYKEKTQTEVAKELGISQVQVSRLEKKILLRMRGKI